MPEPTRIITNEFKTVRETRDDLIRLARGVHQLDNSIWLAPQEAFRDSVTESAIQEWQSLVMTNSGTPVARWSVYLPEVWVGQVAHLVWYVCEASADAGNFRIGWAARSLESLEQDLSAATNAISEAVTNAAGAANTPVALTSSSFTIEGRHLRARILRDSGHAGDTATVGLVCIGGLLVRE